MRRDNHPLQLLIGDIGEREHRPIALVLGRGGTHFDAAPDTIGTSGRGDLKRLALVKMDFRRGGQVERGIVTRDLHRFGGMAHARAKPRQCQDQDEEASSKPQQARTV
ncbi:hypothetical protein RvVAR031_11400 [Agrobacterium vitis]|nr:hypothetical protein RvVAR031_11400 [Agrobacterium vitis]